MRLSAILLLAIGALLSAGQNAQAAFSFQLSPASQNVGIGGSSIINVIAFDNAGNSAFTATSITASATGSANITFNTATVPLSGVAFVGGNTIGSIVVNVSNAAAPLDTASISITFNGVNGILGATTGAQGNIASTVARVTAVPEPSSLALVGLAGLGVVIRRRRRA